MAVMSQSRATEGQGEDARVVIVTGASRGIGRAAAVQVARAGYATVLIARNATDLEEVQAECARHAPSMTVVADVAEGGIRERVAEGLAAFGHRLVHALVNNAGMGIWRRTLDVSAEEWDIQLNTNLRGPFLVTQAVLPHMLRRGGGLVVMVASDSALVGFPERAAYHAAKFGLVGLATCLRAEYHERGIDVSLVYPGVVDTYFRGHRPGDRPHGISADAVGSAIADIVSWYPEMAVPEMVLTPPGRPLRGHRALGR